MDCPPTLSHFIANAPLEGDYYRQIRADIAECDRLGKSIPAKIIDHDEFFDLDAEGGVWRRRIEGFQRTLEAYAPAQTLLDPTSGLHISDDLEEEYVELETMIEGFCKDVKKYKYRVSRILRLPLYVHCLALSQRRPLLEQMSIDCIRDAALPDIPLVGVEDLAVDKDALLKHLRDLRRVDSVVKEWMFTAKIVNSAIAVKDLGWNVDHVTLLDQIRRWESGHQPINGQREMQEALGDAVKEKEEMQQKLEEATNQKDMSRKAYEEAQKAYLQTVVEKCNSSMGLVNAIADKVHMQKALDKTTKQKEELEQALEQANKQKEEKQKALE